MIYYLGFYNSIDSGEKTVNTSFAGVFKMGYIVRKLKEVGKPFKVVSCATREPFGVSKQSAIKKDGYEEIFLKSYRFKGFMRKVGIVLNNMQVNKFLKSVKREDTLIVYHAPTLCESVYKAKKKIGFNLVLEIEEVYSVDQKMVNAEKIKTKEEKLFSIADSYILVNDLIYEKYTDGKKPYTVVYGAYDGVPACSQEKGDGKHILFSGSLDKVRGAELAVETAEHLPKGYVLHLTGRGEEGFVNTLKQKIESVNKNEDYADVIYHGALSDEDLDKLAYTCDIGLNLQDTNNTFEAVSFPSKITFYMLHGLTVVSTKMSSVLASKLNDSISFCDLNANAVAKAIQEVQIKDKQENYMSITNLDKKVVSDLATIL